MKQITLQKDFIMLQMSLQTVHSFKLRKERW